MEPSKLNDYIEPGCTAGYGKYNVGPAKSCNMLLVGRSQTGKSTLVKTLLDPQLGTTKTGFSDTREPELYTLLLTNKETHEICHLNIIDTPGLKEVREDGDSRTDSELLKLATKCVQENITTLNVVCFVSRAGETHLQDTEVFEEVKKCLGDKYARISMMLLTHCDDYKDSRLDQFEDTIKSHPKSKKYYDYCQLGLYRYGAIDLTKLEPYDQETASMIVMSKLKRNEVMREKFLSKILSCTDTVLKVEELQGVYDTAQIERDRVIAEAMQLSHYIQDTGSSKKVSCVIQ
ncbi:unnamed protein product [Oppiella nova]|uniref:AIG1-type G domain-containing protein n=1 Tax=Oppiella nova TaxID=334625 RepID=A0A7R9LN17_9ACAR|nr:unnamed protein product [Oppiella nova]CAG2165272.1 unnamed protein product [Oppiella nova]